MPFSRLSPRQPGTIAVIAALLAVAGCQSGGGAGGMFGGSATTATAAAAPEVNVQELRAFCPQVVLESDGAVLSRYEGGGEGDDTKLIQRSSISDVTRACSYGADAITVNVAVAGRIIPGPLGSTGAVTLPIVIEARRGGEIVYENRANYQVQVNDIAGATQFVFYDPNVVVPQVGAQQVRIFARLEQPAQ